MIEKLRILNEKLEEKLKLIRLYGRTHERTDYPNPFHDLTEIGKSHDEGITNEKEKALDGRCLPELQEDALHHKIREKNQKINELLQIFRDLSKTDLVPSLVEQHR